MNKNMKILIVDDFSTMRKIAKKLLIQLGFINLDEADDGQTAWAKLQSEDYDFIITDWNMPGMSGIELVKNIRANPIMANMPILMVTTESKREQIIEAAKAGVDSYIVKPFTAGTLKEKLEKVSARNAS
jgi:two-component system chemotaxis response regulator CheY